MKYIKILEDFNCLLGVGLVGFLVKQIFYGRLGGHKRRDSEFLYLKSLIPYIKVTRFLSVCLFVH